MLYWITSLLLLSQAAHSTPYVGFPFDQQFPTVARVDTQYTFTISNETYRSQDSTVTYSAEQLPEWLSFDGTSLTFSGYPADSDVTSDLKITLIGTDSTGSISNEYEMVVSEEPAPIANPDESIFGKLSQEFETNGYNGIVLAPGKEFSIQLGEDIFEAAEGSSSTSLTYYGRSANRTSLPSWCSFDSDTVTFSGTAPVVNSDIAPSEGFGFILIGTDVPGFAGISSTFYILVGAHQLSTSIDGQITLQGNISEPLEYTLDRSKIFYDGETITDDVISSTYLSNAPSWLTINGLTIQGTVPDETNDNGAEFNVTLTDSIGNSVTFGFIIDLKGSLFTVDSLPSLNVTKGEFFDYQLADDLLSKPDDTEVSASFSGNEWLTFHADNLTFNGLVPEQFTTLNVEIEANDGNSSESLGLVLRGISLRVTSSSTTSSQSSTSSPTSTGTSSSTNISATPTESSNSDSSQAQSTGINRRNLAIGLGVGIPCFFILVGLLLLCCCMRRRKNRSDGENGLASEKAIVGGPYPDDNTSDASTKREHEDSPRRLNALNALKLDEKDFNSDDMSGLSDGTNIDDTDENIYHDAQQFPYEVKKSWRHNEAEDQLADLVENPTNGKNWKARDSMNSLATVATNELYSVKVVDDNKKRVSQMSNLNLYKDQNLSSIPSLSNSANVQKLDSEGNLKFEASPLPDPTVSASNTDNSLNDTIRFKPTFLENGEVRWDTKHDNTGDAKLMDFTSGGRTSSSAGLVNSQSQTGFIVSDDE
ncbi:BA75_02453T0 [Komagataella pastoris]|uniref:BA75_02453T0 n=1 Tax=Komagataella pastoris TaxID=4922 RepID=A0A1B2JDY4_PICPA|nr:BA75_02453T0 [Komagataella pastoris]